MQEQGYKEKRYEHSWRRTNGFYAEHLGTKCINCGSEEDIAYHHIVPLSVGGTNNLSNIVPVCERCHKAIHGHRTRETYKITEKLGRHSTTTEEKWDEVLSEYVQCRIGNREACERLNRRYSSHLCGAANYKRFCADHGIKKIRNNIDTITMNGKGTPEKGDIVGYIVLATGQKVEMVW